MGRICVPDRARRLWPQDPALSPRLRNLLQLQRWNRPIVNELKIMTRRTKVGSFYLATANILLHVARRKTIPLHGERKRSELDLPPVSASRRSGA
jgi:hypothetical protein